MKPLLLILMLSAMLALIIGSVGASPAGAYFVIYMSQHHWGSHYEPTGYTAPKEVSDNIVVFVLVCLILGPLSLMGIAFSQGNPTLMAIILILAVVVLLAYILPTFNLMTKAMEKESCIPNTVWNTSCGDNQ
jgi:hypothetical protein